MTKGDGSVAIVREYRDGRVDAFELRKTEAKRPGNMGPYLFAKNVVTLLNQCEEYAIIVKRMEEKE